MPTTLEAPPKLNQLPKIKRKSSPPAPKTKSGEDVFLDYLLCKIVARKSRGLPASLGLDEIHASYIELLGKPREGMAFLLKARGWGEIDGRWGNPSAVYRVLG